MKIKINRKNTESNKEILNAFYYFDWSISSKGPIDNDNKSSISLKRKSNDIKKVWGYTMIK